MRDNLDRTGLIRPATNERGRLNRRKTVTGFVMAQDIIRRQASRPTPRIARAFMQSWRELAKGLFDSYRPERHYMRGPGPKWRAKRAYAGDAQSA